MFRQQESAAAAPATSTDERSNSIWAILPSFDPACDDPREYVDKVKFLHSIVQLVTNQCLDLAWLC